MTEERRLIELGIPADKAICICHFMRLNGTLKEYIETEEEKARENIKDVRSV